MSEPMVTIKKADGTTERVPLSKVRGKKQAPASSSLKPPAPAKKKAAPPAQEKKKKPARLAESTSKRAKQKPQKEKPAPPPPKPPAPAKKKPAPPPKSRMEKKMPPSPKPAPSRAPAAPKMEKKYPSFDRQAPVKHAARKTMRTMSQPDIAHSPKPQSAEPHWDTDDHVSLLDASLHDDVPAVVDKKKTQLSTTAPVKDIFKDEAIAAAKAKQPSMKPVVPPRSAPPRPVQGGRPSMHDVRPGSGKPAASRIGTVAVPQQPVKRSVGPVDELASMTAEDFRRLGGNVPSMKEVFMGKFLGLRKESFMIYSDGVRAWRKSPLYQQYLQVVSSALKKKQPIDVALSEVGGLNKDEFESLVEVNMNLGM